MCRIVTIARHHHISHMVGQKLRKGHRRLFDQLSLQSEAQQLLMHRTLHGHGHRRTRISTQLVGNLARIVRFRLLSTDTHLFIIDFHDNVSSAQSCRLRWHSHVRSVKDATIAPFVVANRRTNPGILTCGEGFQFIGARGFVKLGVGVKTIEHITDGVSRHLLCIKRIYVV